MGRNEEFNAGRVVPAEMADRWGSGVGMAHVNQLDRIAFQPLRYNVDELADDIRQNGIREPLHVDYNPDTHRASLGEGNHRLAASKKAGLTHLPVVVHRARYGGEYGEAAVQESEDFPRKDDGYVPGEFNPRYIGLDQEDTSNHTEAVLEDKVASLRRGGPRPAGPRQPPPTSRRSDIDEILRLIQSHWETHESQ